MLLDGSVPLSRSVGEPHSPPENADGILPTPKGHKSSQFRPTPIVTDSVKVRRSTSSVSTIINTPSSTASTSYAVNTPLCFSASMPIDGTSSVPTTGLSRCSTWSVGCTDTSPKYNSRLTPASVPTIQLDSCLGEVVSAVEASSMMTLPSTMDSDGEVMNNFVNPEAPPPPVYLVKTKACRHFARGYCAFGDKCAFAHTAEELRVRPPNLCKTKLCDRGRNCRRPNCGYAHSKAELFHVENSADPKGSDDFNLSDYYQDLQYIEQLGVMYAAASEKHGKL
ncbi:hypothetical protein FOZ63_014086 [Perkinsus olseni]|uniref:C3H1-type domain-containing protein n=1 Tax=Perkinsus olseni TaxID=32597 RepID=A0A7J6TTA3_PEROL|nr:hypothetical protein FOZ63_014086 [Perkinsus olseni]